MLDGDLARHLEGRAVGGPALLCALRRGGMCRRGRKRECEVRRQRTDGASNHVPSLAMWSSGVLAGMHSSGRPPPAGLQTDPGRLFERLLPAGAIRAGAGLIAAALRAAPAAPPGTRVVVEEPLAIGVRARPDATPLLGVAQHRERVASDLAHGRPDRRLMPG